MSHNHYQSVRVIYYPGSQSSSFMFYLTAASLARPASAALIVCDYEYSMTHSIHIFQLVHPCVPIVRFGKAKKKFPLWLLTRTQIQILHVYFYATHASLSSLSHACREDCSCILSLRKYNRLQNRSVLSVMITS